MTAVDATARALGAPRPFAERPRSDGTVACIRCMDFGWEEIPTGSATPTVKPCRCQTRLHERWAAGFPRGENESSRRGGETVYTPKPQPEARQEQF